MQLRELLPRERLIVPLEAASLREAIAAMIRHLGASGAVRDPQALERLLAEARLRDVVPVGGRVALPHFRTDAVADLVVAVGVSPRPLAAREAAFEVAPQVLVLILAPRDAATFYLQTVSAIARVLRKEDVVQRLAQARSADDVLAIAELANLRIQPRLAVRDVMAHNVSTLSPDAPVEEVVNLLVRQRLRALPVVGEKREVLGIVSEWDLVRALLPQLPQAAGAGVEDLEVPPDLRVRDIMTRSVLCISEDMGLDEAANLMINKNVEQFPVVSEGRLVGLLSRADLIRKLLGR
ncbi:MAG: CBS domain-containing protein [Gemmatimonadetes bacterium]|nr:CBS domain-containing protein [Gemmatimonadota bacterium]